MAELNYEQKCFVVQQLACRETPTEVVKAVKEEFGLVVSRQAMQAYDPTKWAGQHLSAELKLIFEKTRKQFDSDIDSIPIANKSYRLLVLQKIIDSVAVSPVIKMQAVEQAEKIMGGMYTNKRDINVTGGAGMVPAGLGYFYGESAKDDSADTEPNTAGLLDGEV